MRRKRRPLLQAEVELAISKTKSAKEDEVKKEEENSSNDDDEFNISLAKMEEEIKPKIINILDSLNKNYSKLQKYQIEKLNCLLASKELSVSKNKNFKRIQESWKSKTKNFYGYNCNC